MDVDLKMASRVRGIDAIFGGHTHDGVPVAIRRQECRRPDAGHQRRLQRQVPGRAGLRRQERQGSDFRYKLLPVFANLLPADAEMQALIDKVRAPLRGQAGTKSWPSPKACSTAAATSTAAGTS
jgi:sulfur-oxidizing protein SoxB